MTVLGIDTATARCGAALAEGDGRIASSASTDAPQAHAERLLALVDECVRAAGPGRRPGAVAVGSGPGSFTGLRIGFSTAKGLCLAWGCPLVAVPTFDAWAFAALREGALPGPDAEGSGFFAVTTAGREDAYVALYRLEGSRPVAAAPAEVLPLDDLARRAAERPGAPVLTDRPAAAAAWFGAGARRIVPAASGNPAEAVAILGASLLAAGGAADLRASEPAYLKDFSTTTKR